ncbi:MAG: polymer-forming cytoskeletal protein [Patescibacteria group bacterium]|jgi:cytoskeletal protein CcmA (bactofilin family)
MALFNSGEDIQNKEVETVIGPSVKVEGNFKGDGNVTVEGMVQGSLKTNHTLKIGTNAKIKAEVEAANLMLSGEIRGNVKIFEKATLLRSAKIFGNLETKVLSVEEGAIINGKCTMVKDEAAPAAEIKKIK